MISSGMSGMAFLWTGITFKNGFASSTKEDVLPFLNNPGELAIWTNDYFLLLADQMKIQE